jgi:hypothetical protein
MATATSPRKGALDNFVLGLNLACALVILVGLAGVISTLAGEYHTWLGVTSWVLLGVGVVLALLFGTLAAPKFDWRGLDTSATTALAVASIGLLLATVLLARSADTQERVQQIAEREKKARELIDGQISLYRGKLKETTDQIAQLNAQLDEQKKAGRTPDPELVKRLDALGKEAEALKGRLAMFEKASEHLEEMVASLNRGDNPKVPATEPPATNTPPASDPKDPKSTSPEEPDDGKKPPAGPSTKPEDSKPGDNKGSDSVSPERFLAKLIALGVMYLAPEFLPALVLFGGDLFDMGVREEDLPAVVRTLKKITEEGKNIDKEEIINLVKNCRDPGKAAAALRKLLENPKVREVLGADTAAELDRHLDQVISSGRPEAPPANPNQPGKKKPESGGVG